MKKKVLTLIVVVAAVLFVISVYQLIHNWSVSTQSDRTYANLQKYVSSPDIPVLPENTAVYSSAPNDPMTPTPSKTWPKVDFESLQQINPDVVGWLYCEGTEINYPVVQGEDNSYYLNHLFDGTYNVNGCLFLDAGSLGDFSGRHSIIYGHHRKNGTMFSTLEAYKDQSYYESHPQMLLMTPTQNYTVEIFAGYVADTNDDAWKLDFTSEAEREAWIQAAMARSTFQSDISPAATDKILTLSTCSYDFNNARYVVLGVLKNE